MQRPERLSRDDSDRGTISVQINFRNRLQW